MNVYSRMWNPHCQVRKNAGLLEEVIENYELIINNSPEYATLPASQGGFSIIDLALISPELGLICHWEILKKYPSLSDHELISLGWNDIEQQNQPNFSKRLSTRWSIQKLLDNEILFPKARTTWLEYSMEDFLSQVQAQSRTLMMK